VWRLQHQEGRDCDVFRAVAEKGHYAGRTVPSDTRQGIYCLAPSGAFLGSINNHHSKRVAAMLTDALAKWDALPDSERWLENLDDDTPTGGHDFVAAQPDGSAVLKVFARDLDRAIEGDDWRTTAFNVDYAWLRPREIEAFVPDDAIGAALDVDSKLVRRFAALHFIDTVRGQSPAFEDSDVVLAELRAKTIAVEGDLQRIEFAGKTRAAGRGKWPVSKFRDDEQPGEQLREVELRLAGMALYDTSKKQFVEFHLVGVGTRAGGTQFNERSQDLAPAPIGFAVVLADLNERIAPANFWRYPNPR
jgi:hypothetical protein